MTTRMASLGFLVWLLLVGQSRTIDVPSVTVPVYPSNASRIDLSNRSLEGRLILIFHSEEPHNTMPNLATTTTTTTTTTSKTPRTTFDWRQVTIKLLNLSSNPRLNSFSIDVAAGKQPDGLYIGELDISGTQMAPLPKRMFQPVKNDSPAPLISIRQLISDGTASEGPLDIGKATDYMYSLRVESFSLAGWKLVNEARLPANITSHRANSCASKRFTSLYINGLLSSDGVDLVGSAGTSNLLAVSDTIDLKYNRLRTVANVSISARRIDLSNNQLVELSNVAFRPGTVCGAVVSGPPTLLLRGNQLGSKALESLSGQIFSGLDLGENPSLLRASLPTSESPIYVAEYLDLSGLWTGELELSSLLARFRHFNPSVFSSSNSRFRLSLNDNWLPNLAAAVALVDEFLRNGDGNNRSMHLDISGNPRLVHLNLSDLPTDLIASLTVRRLPHLHSASIRIEGDAAAAAMERLRRKGQRPTIDDLIGLLYQRGSTLRLDAQPNDCCLRADASELVCSFDSHAGQTRSRQRGSVFCYNDEANNADNYNGFNYGRLPQPPELPLLFSCAVLGGALFLGLATGVAFFYARRRSRGKYAVYSVYDVRKLKTLQQQNRQLQPHQLATVGRSHVTAAAAGGIVSGGGRPPVLKAVSIVQLPLDSTVSTNATHL